MLTPTSAARAEARKLLRTLDEEEPEPRDVEEPDDGRQLRSGKRVEVWAVDPETGLVVEGFPTIASTALAGFRPNKISLVLKGGGVMRHGGLWWFRPSDMSLAEFVDVMREREAASRAAIKAKLRANGTAAAHRNNAARSAKAAR